MSVQVRVLACLRAGTDILEQNIRHVCFVISLNNNNYNKLFCHLVLNFVKKFLGKLILKLIETGA